MSDRRPAIKRVPRLEHYRLVSTDGGLWVDPDYQQRLARWGLRVPADFARHLEEPGMSIDERRTAVRYLAFDEESLFLKFYTQPGVTRRLHAWLQRRGTAMSHELSMLDKTAAAGIRAPAPIAVGHLPHGFRYLTFLLMTAIEGYTSLEDIMFTPEGQALAARPHRSLLTQSLARLVRQMHEGGIHNPTLYTRHLYIRLNSVGLEDLALIDMERARSGRISPERRARDLAALLLTSSPDVRRTDSVRFLRCYLGPRHDRLAMKWLWRRTASIVQAKRSERRFKQYQLGHWRPGNAKSNT